MLTDKQVKFCELVGHGMHIHDAYRKAYNYNNPNIKLVDNNARRLMRNKAILEEIERIQYYQENPLTIDAVTEHDRAVVAQATDFNKDEVGKWTQGIALNKLQTLLSGCEESMVLMKERPRLFSDVKALIADVKKLLRLDNQEDEKWQKDLVDCMENIEDIIYKVGKFKATEFNSTINTANSLMKEINNLTGVSKNIKEIQNETFENRLLDLIKEAKGEDLKKELTDYAFETDNG